MKSNPLFREVLQCPEYRQYRKQQKRDILFYSIVNILICTIGFCTKNGDIAVLSDFLLTGFILFLFFLIAYTAKRPSIQKGIIYEKKKSGQTYIHTVKDEYEKYLCTYRTLGDSAFEENDSVYLPKKSNKC